MPTGLRHRPHYTRNHARSDYRGINEWSIISETINDFVFYISLKLSQGRLTRISTVHAGTTVRNIEIRNPQNLRISNDRLKLPHNRGSLKTHVNTM